MRVLTVMVLAAAAPFAAPLDLKHLDLTAPDAPIALNNLATNYYNQARYAEAEALYRTSLKLWEKRKGAAVPDIALTMANLGTLLRVTGRYGEAETLLLESLRRLEAAGDTAHAARALGGLAVLYRVRGDFEKAEVYALRATADENQPMVLASIYIAQRRFDEAETLLRGTVDARPPRVAATIYNDLAAIAIACGRYEEAEGNASKAIELARRNLPPAHPTLATALNNLAQAYRFQGRYLDAEHLYREALELWEAALGPEHPDVARGLMNLAAFYHERGRETGAEDLYLRAAGIFERAFGRNDPLALVARNELADVLRGERRFSEAEKLARSTLAALEKALPADDERVERARLNWARLSSEKSLLARAK